MKFIRDFSIVCLLAITIMGISIGLVLNENIARNIVEQAKLGTADTFSSISRAYFSKENLQIPKTGSEYDDFTKKIKLFVETQKDILNIKYLNSNYIVTWATDKNTIGKQFPKSKELTGEVLSNIKDTSKGRMSKIKNMFLQNLNGNMQLYIPIRFPEQGEVSATIEVSKSLKDTYAKVREEQTQLWYMLGSGFLCLYLSLFGMVWKAAKHIREQSEDVSEGLGLKDELYEREPYDVDKMPDEHDESKDDKNQIVNKSAILEYAGGEKKILQAIIEAFIGDSEKLLIQINGAIKEEDSKALEAASHSLKKALQDLSARAAYNAAERLENISMESDISHAKEAYTSLKKEMKRLRPELADISQEA